LSAQQQKLREFLEREALALGFDQVGVAKASDADDRTETLRTFTQKQFHGSMEWMQETAERRGHPQSLWADVSSVIMLATNYAPEHDPQSVLGQPEKAAISVYAQHRDYHDVIKGRLKTLSAKLLARAKELGLEGQVKVFVDTAPVMEKPLAEQAGLGWQGKHTNLVSRDLGSWFFLGSIFTTLELAADEPEIDHCGSCNSCLEACPTNAFPTPFAIDARRCISYLTIENKGPIPNEFREAMGNRVYGCDDCLAACPWNKFAQTASEVKLRAPDDWADPDLAELLQLDDEKFRTRFSGSPVKRIGWNSFMRNCLIAAGNSGSTDLLAQVEPFLANENPTLSDAAQWAHQRLKKQKLKEQV